MRNRIAHLLATVLLCATSQADIVTYTITGATGDNWSGQFEVADLSVSASDNAGNTLSISAGEWSPIYSDTPDYMYYFGSGGEHLEWVCYDTTNGWQSYGLKLDSSDLKTVLAADEWNTTWNDLIGNTYALDTGTDVYFHHSTGVDFHGIGGQISFAAVPEPATALILGLGGALIALYRRFFGRV